MKLLRIKQFFNTIAVFAAIFMSFGVGTPVTAMSSTSMDGMPHEASINLQNCINQHHVVPGTATKIDTDELDDNDPQPQPLPYFTQFQSASFDTTQTPPKDITRSSSYRPPDLVRLTNNIRF